MSEAIRQAVRKMVGDRHPEATVCTVTAVNRDACTVDCEPVNGDAPFLDVRLRAAADDVKRGIVALPAVNSTVVVALVEGQTSAAYVAAVSEVDELLVETAGGMTTAWKKDVIELNGKKYALIKDDELKKDLEKMNDVVQALLNIISGPRVPEPGNGAPSALQTALAGAAAGKLLPTYNNIRNENVLHG